MVTTATGHDSSEDSAWYLDTGCSNHMIGRRDWLVDLNSDVHSKVRFADDSTHRAEGMGKVLIQKKDGRSACISDVLYSNEE